MQCEICNADLKRGQRTLCSSCRQSIARLVAIQARLERDDCLRYSPHAQADQGAMQAGDVDLSELLQTHEPSDATPHNPYWEGSAIAAMFDVLSDGNWHSLAALKDMFKVDVDKRLLSIRRKGEKEAVWRLEISQGRVRLATKK